MRHNRVGTIVAELAPGQSMGRRRRAGRRLLCLAGMQGLLAVPFLAWMAGPVSVLATAASESVGLAGSPHLPEVAGKRVEGSTQPLPEMVPPAEASHRFESAGTAWFAYRDARTGELVVPPPQVIERLGAASRLAREPVDAVLVERRLPNGAVEIDLPEELASPLYGWFDEHGELRTGHVPPPRLLGGSDGAGAGERRDGR